MLESFRAAPAFVDAQRNTDNFPQEFPDAPGVSVAPGCWLVILGNGLAVVMSHETFTAGYEPNVTFATESALNTIAQAMELNVQHLNNEARARAENCTAFSQQIALLQLAVDALTRHASDPSATSLYEVTHMNELARFGAQRLQQFHDSDTKAVSDHAAIIGALQLQGQETERDLQALRVRVEALEGSKVKCDDMQSAIDMLTRRAGLHNDVLYTCNGGVLARLAVLEASKTKGDDMQQFGTKGEEH